jgi:hypothetical protein
MNARRPRTALGVLAAGIAAAITAAAPALAAGGSWQVDSHPQPAGSIGAGFNSVFAASRSQAWAVGFEQLGSGSSAPLLERWNGSRWAIASGAPGTATGTDLDGVAGTGPADVWIVGQGPTGGPLIEHFNGTSWTTVPTPADPIHSLPALQSVSADSPTDAWAGGSTTGVVGATATPLIWHWNGTAWKPAKAVPVPCYACAVASIAAISSTDVWALGFGVLSTSPDLNQSLEFLEHWDGRHWHVALNPFPGFAAALGATSADDVWAVGDAGLIEHFNGKTWTQVPNLGGDLAGVAALSPTDAWAMSFDGKLTEHWNGTAWQAVPTAANLPAGFQLGQDSGGDHPGAPAMSGIAGGPLFAVGGNDLPGGNGQSTILSKLAR